MPSAIALEYFERRMLEMGSPLGYTRAKVRELADHYEDLKQAALEAGLPEAEASARAEVLLGDPVRLAENIVDGLRRASWWGRHPVVGFCVAPFFGLALAWTGCAAALFWINVGAARLFGPGYSLDEKTLSALAGNEEAFENFVNPFILGMLAFSLIVLTAGGGWLARRGAVGLRWKLAACGACMAACWVTTFSIRPHNLTIGMSMGWSAPYWPFFGIPAAAAVLALARQRWLLAGLALIPQPLKDQPRLGRARSWSARRFLMTPTYWVVTVLTVYVVVGMTEVLAPVFRDRAREAHLRSAVWPAERAATLAHLVQRQRTDPGGRELPIDLKPWVNASLLESTDGGAGVTNNNLAALPAGLHSFAGVPFNVAGRLQLAGLELSRQGRFYPERIRHIIVHQKCARIHLLHGASAVHSLDKRVASLVLHYTDGSRADLGIVAGADLLDWWGPIYNTDADDDRNPKSAGTELAWAGTNGRIAERAPDYSLRLYRTTFANPHPERTIASIDYVSTLTDAAPFLAGLTVELSTN